MSGAGSFGSVSGEALEVGVADAVATVTLRGPRGNAQGPAFWRECPAVFAGLAANDDVRVVVVRGGGKGFCSGLDLLAMAGELAGMLATDAGARERAQLLSTIAAMQAALSSIFLCEKPVVAAVHGFCIGGGLDLAAACDLRFASKTAVFSLREVKMGIVADVGSLQRLPHIIGEAATRELAFTGNDVDAVRARELGLVSAVYDDDDALFAGALAVARDIAAHSPLVVSGIKRVMNARIQREIDEGLRTVAAHNAAFLPSADLQEAVAAFAEKRAPRFTGR